VKRRPLVAGALATALLASTLLFATSIDRAEAAFAGQFNPGMLISDAFFFDGNAMPVEAVQSFLNSKVSSCASGYTCLKDYRQDTTSKAAVAGRCGAYDGAAQEFAANIIAKVGAACGISQKALLVLLEKEQSLVSSTAPSANRYRSATGYGCPDTAACDSAYYGFFNQVYMAALQFKRYAANPTGWNHIAGRVNNIRFHPNAACGSSGVLIQNQATAGLYNYTPYQPNAAALNNLYGTGDGCSSYGNRNFWRIFTDWFGSTSVSSLVRTADNAGVYLVVDNIKYSVPNMTILGVLSPLGPLSIVSQSYLDGLTTAHAVGRVLRAPNGAIYFIDSAIKLPFADCQSVADYGGSCAPTGYVNVSDAQIALFHTGPAMTSVLGTREGTRYQIQDGIKHEILDDQSQIAAGLPFGFPILTENAISALPFGSPVARESVLVGTRGGGASFFLASALRYPVAAGDAAIIGLSSPSAGVLRAESLALIPPAGSDFTGAFTGPSGQLEVLTLEGRAQLIVPAAAGLGSVSLPRETIDRFTDVGPIGAGAFVKAQSGATVYVVTPDSLRPVVSWSALLALAMTSSPRIHTLTGGVVAALPLGGPALGPGMMYRTANDPQVFLVDGLGSRIRINSFENTDAAGYSGLTFTDAATLGGYPVAPAPLGYGLQCGTTSYVAAGGQFRAVTPATSGLFPFTYQTLDATTCAHSIIGAPAIDFIRIPSGAIYQLVDGEKRWVSAARLPQVNAGQGWMQVATGFAALLPTGAPA
jgi:hypothetical protein